MDVKRAGKMAERIDRAKAMTFGLCAAEYVKEHQAEWKGEKHVKLWNGSLKKYVLPLNSAELPYPRSTPGWS